MPPALTFEDPGVHGAVITGMHGCGVRTPEAAEVAAATCGFDSEVHMPNGATFVMGMLSTIRASGLPPSWISGGAGTTDSVEGVTPNVQVIWAPLTTRSGTSCLPCSTSTVRAAGPSVARERVPRASRTGTSWRVGGRVAQLRPAVSIGVCRG